MRSHRWRILTAAVAAAVLLAACGSQEEPEKETLTVTEEEVKETEEEIEKEPEEAEAINEPEEVEEPEEEPPEWVTVYREFLSDRENLEPLLLEKGEGGLPGYITGFYLHDLNKDEVPELFVQKDYVADYIYTYVDSHMELRNAIMYNAFGEAYFGFDKRDGQVYDFQLSAGTGTDQLTSMEKVSLMETSHDMEKTADVSSTYYEGLETVCSALFGSIEQEDGYINVEWEDAVFSDEQFKDLAMNFVPFDFHEITDENIETYITAAYADVAEPCSLEIYREKAQNRREAFSNTKYSYKVRDGEYVIPETAFEMEDSSGIVYCDTELLTCFMERDLEPEFEGDWKQVYREWLLMIDKETDYEKQREICRGNNIPDRDVSSFFFWNWDEVENPILCFVNEDGILVYDYYAVLDGKVVYLGYAGREFLGYSYLLPIMGTDYYFKYHSYGGAAGYSNYNVLLNKVGNPRENIWEMHWEESYEIDWEYIGEENDAEYVPEFGVDNPDCKFRGEQMSKQNAMDEVDKLLGEGAAKQLLDVLYLSETNEKAEGPLSFIDDTNRSDYTSDSYTWEQLMDVLDTP